MSRLDAGLGSIEFGEDSVVHPGYPHLLLSLPLTPGEEYLAGTVLQLNTAGDALEGGDFTKRTYVAAEPIGETDTVALVVALGAVKTDRLLKPAGTALTSVEVLTLMEKSPLACV